MVLHTDGVANLAKLRACAELARAEFTKYKVQGFTLWHHATACAACVCMNDCIERSTASVPA